MSKKRKQSGVNRHFDIDEMLTALLDEVRSWHALGNDTDFDGFEQLRIRFYRAVSVPPPCPALIDRDENPGRASCPFCGRIHD